MYRLRTLPLLAAILLGVALFAGCEEQPATHSDSPPLQLPDQILTDFDVEMTRGETRSATFHASHGVIYRKRDSMLVADLVAHLFDAEGDESSVLWADSGLIRERRQSLTAGGNVRVQSRDSVRLFSDSLFWYGEFPGEAGAGTARADTGEAALRYMVAKSNVHLVTADSVQLWTDTLLWNDLRKTVATDAYVTIVRRGEDTLRGRGLRSDDELRRITIQEEASGSLTRPPSQGGPR